MSTTRHFKIFAFDGKTTVLKTSTAMPATIPANAKVFAVQVVGTGPTAGALSHMSHFLANHGEAIDYDRSGFSGTAGTVTGRAKTV
ncbi:hypothetical protein [Oceanibacterium hippocampi]|uniref:Uncharacterized protein n=1 Tax=Oceanibacterium hippocampi TaxID=745714 RepID=A0A1Y5U5G5_9PROT|nr:hypothetical protein [Oceanibacterium hippocampi]SLN77374.1 hypothetical protein OCH7691_04392 [Oceanibacterium hippocampi]